MIKQFRDLMTGNRSHKASLNVGTIAVNTYIIGLGTATSLGFAIIGGINLTLDVNSAFGNGKDGYVKLHPIAKTGLDFLSIGFGIDGVITNHKLPLKVNAGTGLIQVVTGINPRDIYNFLFK